MLAQTAELERAIRTIADLQAVVDAASPDMLSASLNERVLVANAQLDKEIFKRTTTQNFLRESEAKNRVLASQLAEVGA